MSSRHVAGVVPATLAGKTLALSRRLITQMHTELDTVPREEIMRVLAVHRKEILKAYRGGQPSARARAETLELERYVGPDLDMDMICPCLALVWELIYPCAHGRHADWGRARMVPLVNGWASAVNTLRRSLHNVLPRVVGVIIDRLGDSLP